MGHVGFWWELLGRLGAPMFAATLVGGLLSGDFQALHGVLLLTGLAMMWVGHWHEYHQGRSPRG